MLTLPHTWLRKGAVLSLVLFTAACASPKPGEVGVDGVFDPYEAENRSVHRLNVGLDRALLRPAGKAYVTVVPDDAQTLISNAADNLSEPSNVMNHFFQGDLKGVGTSLFRFALNSTLGLGGFFDPAAEFGVTAQDTDFGETLHVWGFEEGAYVELPALGPSTERDAVGKAVDLLTDPVGHLIPDAAATAGTGLKVADRLGSRGKFGDAIDGILYGSADSYAQTRLFYLQNRRFELGIEAEETYIDPTEIDTNGF